MRIASGGSATNKAPKQMPKPIRGVATDMAMRLLQKEKAARRRLLNSNPMILDQAASNAALFFRRYAMTPTPAKPRIIIAHVLGSGTAVILAISGVEVLKGAAVSAMNAVIKVPVP